MRKLSNGIRTADKSVARKALEFYTGPMLLRAISGDDVVLITQPAHAWVSGQLARHWRHLPQPDLAAELFLATELHDVGFLAPDRSPDLNLATRLPYSFLDLPKERHLAIWSDGIHQMMSYGRLPALLVSMHYTHLATAHPPEAMADQRRNALFLEEQEELQDALRASLFQQGITEETIQIQRQFLSFWDFFSLALCLGINGTTELDASPDHPLGKVLRLVSAHDADVIQVDPWPFIGKEVTVTCEGRRLLGRFDDQEVMRRAIRASSPAVLRFRLVPAAAA